MNLLKNIPKRTAKHSTLNSDPISRDPGENVYGAERTITVGELVKAIGKAKKVAYNGRNGSTLEDKAYKEGVVFAIETLKMYLGRDVVLLDISEYENK